MIVLINTEEVPQHGLEQSVIRCRASDKADVHRAAMVLGLKPSVFMRMAMVNVARRVLDEFDNRKRTGT